MSSVSESRTPTLVNELDLMHYVDVLKGRWWWIVGCGILGAVLTFFWANSAPPSYNAQAELAILRVGSIVNFDSRFRTISDADPNATALDTVARRRSLISLGESPAVAEQVINELGDQLPASLRTIEGLRGAVTLTSDGDVIRVAARTGVPETSELIANTWAAAYVARANQVFSENVLEPENLQQLALELKKDFDAKQAAVTEDKATSEIQRILREKDYVERQLDVARQDKLSQLIEDATALRALVANGTGDATPSQQVAMLMLQVNLFKTNDETTSPIDVPITADVTPRSRNGLLQELDVLIQNLEERYAALSGKAREDLYSQLRALRAQEEVAETKTKELESARDLAWNTYLLVESKVTENKVSAETDSKLVQLSSPAVAPSQPVAQQAQLKTIMGALAGMVVGAALALVIKSR